MLEPFGPRGRAALTHGLEAAERLRREWAAAGRQAYAEGIRRGEDLRARTESELEALGRDAMAKAQAVRTTAREVGRDVGRRTHDAGVQLAAGLDAGVAQVSRGARRAVDRATTDLATAPRNAMDGLAASARRMDEARDQVAASVDASRQGLEAATGALRRGVDATRELGRRTTLELARQVSDRGARVADAGARRIDDAMRPALPLVELAMGLGDKDDPGSGRLIQEWRRGDANARDLGPETRFAQAYASAPSVQASLAKAAQAWRERDGSWDASGGRFIGARAPYGPLDLISGIARGRLGPVDVIGSARLDGERHGDRLDWTASNTMGRHSFYAGNLADTGNRTLDRAINTALYDGQTVAGGPRFDARLLPSVPDRETGPFASTTQRIRFSTDLEGRPIR